MTSAYQLPTLAHFKKTFPKGSSALIILKNSRGMHIAFTNYGARIVSIIVPDKDGRPKDIVQGFNHIDDYLNADEIYHGATIGRFANRIKDGRFEIHHIPYRIQPNNGPNALHGGKGGFHQQLWDRRINNPNQVTFYYNSPDGEEGFPGTLKTAVSYLLTEENELKIRYRASTDKDTVINLTNHAYFNLNGEGEGNILDHEVLIHAHSFIPINANQIPEGKIRTVKHTPFDFTSTKQIGKDLNVADTQLTNGGGYDHCFVLDRERCNARTVVASAYSKKSGIKLELLTTEPGVQFYTGNALTGKDIGKTGKAYGKQSAFCFETQHFPDSPNRPTFPSTMLKVGQSYQSETIYRFKVLK